MVSRPIFIMHDCVSLLYMNLHLYVNLVYNIFSATCNMCVGAVLLAITSVCVLSIHV